MMMASRTLLDGIANYFRLVVEGLELYTGRESFANLVEFFGDGVGDGDGVAVGLAEQVQKHSWFAIRGDDRIHRHHGGRDIPDIADVHGDACRSGLHYDVGDLGRGARLTAHKREHQFVIVLEEPGGIHHVALRYGVEDVLNGDLRFEKLGRIRLDLKFGNLAALQHHHGNAVDAIEARLIAGIIRRDVF